jgi:hypothetical protein
VAKEGSPLAVTELCSVLFSVFYTPASGEEDGLSLSRLDSSQRDRIDDILHQGTT